MQPERKHNSTERTDVRGTPRTLSWLNPAFDPLGDRRDSLLDTEEVGGLIKAIFPSYRPSTTMFDMDGVLVEDWCTPEPEPPDVEEYDPWWRHVHDGRPCYLPSEPVLGIASGRLECYRKLTGFWLARYDVSYGRLFLSAYDSCHERDRQSPAMMKAGRYYNSPATLFIESNLRHAITIAGMAQKPVFCMEKMELLEVLDAVRGG